MAGAIDDDIFNGAIRKNMLPLQAGDGDEVRMFFWGVHG
jgi:hypothetical protein